MLDFGCGSGGFTSQFLPLLAWPPERLHLSLVEPDPVYRQQAVDRLQSFTTDPIQAWPAFPVEKADCFDLVLANHVFYYVPDLDQVLAQLLGSLADSGVLLAAIAGQKNNPIQFWNHCFALIGQPVPFYTAEDFEGVLMALGTVYLKQDVAYELVFPDSEQNRLTLLLFLLGSHFPKIPCPEMLDLFNPYSHDGQIQLQTTHEQFVICEQQFLDLIADEVASCSIFYSLFLFAQGLTPESLR
jgi:SAM-dependent methyltransferase